MLGVNSRAQLADAETAFQARRRRELMEQGVTFLAPDTVFLSADTVIEPDASIGQYVVFGPGVTVQQGRRDPRLLPHRERRDRRVRHRRAVRAAARRGEAR